MPLLVLIGSAVLLVVAEGSDSGKVNRNWHCESSLGISTKGIDKRSSLIPS